MKIRLRLFILQHHISFRLSNGVLLTSSLDSLFPVNYSFIIFR